MVVAINSERPSYIASSFCNHSDSVQMIWCFKKGLADITAILSQKGQLSKKKKKKKKISVKVRYISISRFKHVFCVLERTVSLLIEMVFLSSQQHIIKISMYSYLGPC